ncbi:hypothetical protein HOLleu_38616 [Holothuria leucospilota]|uniref:Uncharacterized protein n=1 Tax=Holothuria leucospilota TaxID=206669 RepID=A0A9Q1BCD3_HOLLE|nr:hypothetical protein HOLleu_38616 [Holothuria leucospilota]
MESSREFNFNAAFLEFSRRNCLRKATLLRNIGIVCYFTTVHARNVLVIARLCALEVSIKERSRNCSTVCTGSFC